MNNIYEILEQRIEMVERNAILHFSRGNMSSSELTTAYDQLKKNQELQKQKLGVINDLEYMAPRLKEKFLEVCKYAIEDIEKIDDLLTFGVLLVVLNLDLTTLNYEECLVAGKVMSAIPKEHYTIYGDLICSPEVIRQVMDKTTDEQEYLTIYDELFNYYDAIAYESMSDEDYNKAINSSISIVNNCHLNKRVK